MNTKERNARIRQIYQERQALQAKVDELGRELSTLQLERKKEEHPCSCVKLNKDIEIFDMQEQERRGREPLSAGGFVADTLSARKDCQECKGTGIPTKHNHFGETFLPDTCPACRTLQRNID